MKYTPIIEIDVQKINEENKLQNPPIDPYEEELFGGRTEAEIAEMQQYMARWTSSTYTSVAHNIWEHALRKDFDPLKYLRKAHNFNKRRAARFPKTGYRRDDSAVYRKGQEYLIVKPDVFGTEKIVTYGLNDE